MPLDRPWENNCNVVAISAKASKMTRKNVVAKASTVFRMQASDDTS
ncbi:predicted protein [Sclerotinia sclerotiorum 1980 UF-70]|uniref:Uncharacterized protein n=1 Tax=Sclerotinia sclerotiorum (strain ATCC 18683 / 1980 / Ss-1) TaxID=665079 RepID=A7EXB6_SCLS1|nr:predicted protein [Sclerotinia sclerotiorum 1980 UF-70]EDN94108.1 predicted protein [Sclerotinia sclerotiorum 1980 UF-70]